MPVQLVDGKAADKVLPRRYPPEQRRWFDKYVGQLERMGFVKHKPTDAWQSAPLLVSKHACFTTNKGAVYESMDRTLATEWL